MSQDLVSVLRNLPFLDEVADENVRLLASLGSLHEFSQGAVIFHEGQKADRLQVIVEGTVSLEFCAPGMGCKCFQTIGSGDLVAWSPLLHLEGMMATARALEATKTVAFDVKQLKALFEQNPRFGYEFMSRLALVLAQRLGATRLQLLEVCNEQMPVASKHHAAG